MGGTVRPIVQNYTCYRKLLGDFCEYNKSSRRGFSYRQLASKVGLKTPNYIQRIIGGQRNLTEETAETIGEALKLDLNENEYFVCLVSIENARNDESRSRAEVKRRLAAKELVCRRKSDAEREIFSDFRHLLVRELLLFSGFKPDGQWMSQKLSGFLTPEECLMSLELLTQTGLVAINDGAYSVAETSISVEISELALSLWGETYASALRFFSENINKLPQTERELHLLNVPINSKKIPELIRRIRRFQDELIGWLQEEDNPTQLIQVGTFLFPYR